jgi:protein-disulfide isomerase
MKKEQIYAGLVVLVVVLLVIAGSLWTKNTEPQVSQVDLNLGQKNSNPATPGTANLDALPAVSASDHIKGSLNAPVKIVVYSDLECPFCKTFHWELMKAYQEFGASGQVAIVYRNFPIDSLHPKARNEAAAAECVAEIGGNDKYWQFLDKLFTVTPSNNGLDPAQLPILAQSVGISAKDFQTCLASGKYAAEVGAEVLEAEKLGAQGTPFPVVVTATSKTPLGGFVPYEQFRPLIVAGLK